MEYRTINGTAVPFAASIARAEASPHDQNLRLTCTSPQNHAPDLPLLKYIAEQDQVAANHLPDKVEDSREDLAVDGADQDGSGPEATQPGGVTGNIIPFNCQVDRRPGVATFLHNDQPTALFDRIGGMEWNAMQQATTGEILPLIMPIKAEPRRDRRARIVGEWPALLSRDQLCEYLDICPSTLAMVCPVAPVDLAVNVLRWRRSDIDRWLATLSLRALKSRSCRNAQTGNTAPPTVSEGPEERRAAFLDRARRATKARS